MKVSICRKCEHCQRMKWSSSYKPANYHEIGVSHVYAYCDVYKKKMFKN